jgi:multidrug resistance efflux pump
MTAEDNRRTDEASETPEDQVANSADDRSTDPVRKWTLILLGACAVLMIYYVVADRITPYTAQARVNALVVPIAAEVSGTVTEVTVQSNQAVETGKILFRVDRERYALAVETAQANLQSARQATGASTANIDAAKAQRVTAQANLLRAEQDVVRLRRIKQEDPGAISDRRVEMAEASFTAAQAALQAAEANLERARQDLGETGEANYRILQARAALDQAELDLVRTSVVAPDNGVVTDVRVDRGNFAQAGAPLMTFLASHDIWVQADFTENNLGNIKPGDEVDIVFDALPGKVVKGTIRTTGFGVNVDSAPLGSLPTIDNDRQWLRDAQRFSVIVDFELPDAEDRQGIRVGAQASVLVYTGGGFLFNSIAWIKMRLLSLFTYFF